VGTTSASFLAGQAPKLKHPLPLSLTSSRPLRRVYLELAERLRTRFVKHEFKWIDA
jgi:hypothetical protein